MARILVVDDEADIRLIMGLNLSLMGMESGEAGNGSEAIKALTDEKWDGVVLDLAMPGSDGFEVLKHLTQTGTCDDQAVVVLSAKGSPRTAMRALEMGAHAHLTKPFSPSAVAQTIMELVELSPEARAERRVNMIERAGTLNRLKMPIV